HSHYPDPRILFFQVSSGSGKRPSGSYPCHKNVHLSLGISPNFRTCRFVVGTGIGRIVKLPRQKSPRRTFYNLFRFFNGAAHSSASLCENNFRPVGLENVSSFHAHSLRHSQNQTVSSGGGQGRSEEHTS